MGVGHWAAAQSSPYTRRNWDGDEQGYLVGKKKRNYQKLGLRKLLVINPCSSPSNLVVSTVKTVSCYSTVVDRVSVERGIANICYPGFVSSQAGVTPSLNANPVYTSLFPRLAQRITLSTRRSRDVFCWEYVTEVCSHWVH